MDSQVSIKRTAKDSVFTDLFSDPKHVLELYQALHPEDTSTTTNDIKEAKLKCVLAEHEYNDLSFQVGEKLLLFIEAQSTWSKGIVLRMMSYVIQELNNYFEQKGISLYPNGTFICPKPELYVIYTGNRKHCPRSLSFKKAFLNDCKKCDLDATVHILRKGKKKGDIIQQYITFCKVFTAQVKKYPDNPRKAIEETIRICKEKQVLVEYLNRRETEIMDIMTILFDQEHVTAQLKRHREREMQEKIEKKVKKAIEKTEKRVKEETEKRVKEETEKRVKEETEKRVKEEIEKLEMQVEESKKIIKKNREEIEIEKEASRIEAITTTCRSLNKTYDETKQFLQSTQSMAQDTVDGYMKKYWK